MLLVGRVDKPHGLRGEVVVSLTTNREERVAPGARLYLDSEGGRELTVLTSTPFTHRWIVAFDGVFDRNGSEAISHRDLYAEPLDDPDALWVHELVGKRVVDQHEVDHGPVVAVEANPASDLLVLESGALVPMRFVTDTRDDIVTVDVPDGLFD
ncbi:MAG: rRNA processing protein RimM [Actinomycetota bacterium]|jgi:16S rRNA processing protein RimM